MYKEKKLLIGEIITFILAAIVLGLVIWIFPYARNSASGSEGGHFLGGTLDLIMFICYVCGALGFAGITILCAATRLKAEFNGWVDIVFIIFSVAIILSDIAFLVLTFTLKS